MAYDGSSTGGPGPSSALPPIGKLDGSKAREFFRERIYSLNSRRREDLLTIRRADLYQQCAQWLQRTANAWDVDSFSGWQQTAYDPADPLYVPLPVINVGFSHIQNESARLSKPDYKVRVTPRTLSSSDLECREAAKVSERLIENALKKLEWDKVKDRRAYHMPVYGGYWIRSYYDLTYDNTTVVPVTGSVSCPSCSFSLASPTVSADLLRSPAGMSHINSAPFALDLAPDNKSATYTGCPDCAARGESRPLQPNMSMPSPNMLGSKDPFGRQLYAPSPIGTWRISIPSPYNIFPRDLGIGISWGQQAEWTECHVETLDWIALRYPQQARKVQPERSDMLDYWHPLTSGTYSNGRGSSFLFRDSARVKEFHKAPWMEWVPDNPSDLNNTDPNVPGRFTYNKGRSIVMAGDVILFDGPLMLDSLTGAGGPVPRVHMEYVPWEIRDGGDRLQGLSLWELLFDAQDIINSTTSQRAAHRERLAVATIVASKEHNLSTMTMPGIPGRIITIDVDPQSQTFLPRLLEGTNTTIDPGVDREKADIGNDMNTMSGKVEVEEGRVPGQVASAIAIRLLNAQTSERREPRVRRMRESDRRIIKHGAELLQAMTIEPVELSYETVTGDEAWAFYLGSDMSGQTDIELDVVPDFEEKARVQQLVTDMVNAQQIDLARKGRIVAKIQEAPPELFEDDNRQVETAQLEWIKLRDSARPPRVDPMLDSHQIHNEQHALDLMSSEGRSLEEAADWDNVLKALGASWEQISQMALMQTQFMPQPGVDLQDAILNLWMQALQALQQAGVLQLAGDQEALQKILTFRAHLETHRLLMQQQQMQSMQQPMPAPGGAPADAAGNIPSPASPDPTTPSQTITNVGITTNKEQR